MALPNTQVWIATLLLRSNFNQEVPSRDGVAIHNGFRGGSRLGREKFHQNSVFTPGSRAQNDRQILCKRQHVFGVDINVRREHVAGSRAT